MSTSAPLRIVGLGDSIPGALNCSGCSSYVEVYGTLAGEALGRVVDVTNLATNDSLQSAGLVERVLTNQDHRDALAEADIVTLHIGLNDLDVVVCGGLSDLVCWDALENATIENVATILDEVTTLRAGRPTAVRVTTMFNPYPGAVDVSENAPWQAFWAREFQHFASLTCTVATAHGAVCVDLLPLFNGLSGAGDPSAYLQPNPDHVHLNQDGHDLVAEAIATVGFAPIQ